MNYYELLEVSPNASQEVIRAAYKSLMQRYHPDKNNENPEFSERFLLIRQAYEVLSDPVKRTAYDLQLIQQRKKNFNDIEESNQNPHSPITIKKNKPNNSWPWVATILIVVVAGYFAAYADKRDKNEQEQISRTESLRLSMESESKLAAIKQANEEKYEQENLKKRTLQLEVNNLTVLYYDNPFGYSVESRGAEHLLLIPRILVRIGKRDSDNVAQYIKENQSSIIKNLEKTLTYGVKNNELIKIDGKEYLQKIILESVNNTIGTQTGTDRETAYPNSYRGIEEVILPESFSTK